MFTQLLYAQGVSLTYMQFLKVGVIITPIVAAFTAAAIVLVLI